MLKPKKLKKIKKKFQGINPNFLKKNLKKFQGIK
jgi:hypothetical protein